MTRRMMLAAACMGVLIATSAIAQPATDVTHYSAVIRFDLQARSLSGIADVTIRNSGTTPMPSIALDLRDLAVAGVKAGTTVCTYVHADGVLTVTPPAPVAAGDSVVLTIEYGGTATSEAGPSSWGGCFWGSTTFSMGVGFYAPYVSMTRHWLPSHDIPSDKATFDLTYVVPEGWVAAGSGLLASRTSGPDGVAYRWVENHPTATYLVTYAIAQYAVLHDTWNGLPLEYYVTKSDSAHAVPYFSTVPGMLEAFTRAFGPYPFDKAGYCVTPIGAMEHQTMISYPSSLMFDTQAGSTAAHELAHMWWGDMVSVQDFREAWLSEGFASFAEAIYAEYKGGQSAYLQSAVRFASTYRTSVQPYEGTFALYDFPRSSPSSNYPQTIYQKGAAVLVMLRHIMGDSLFFAGLRSYGARYAYGNATTTDFRIAMEEKYGAPLDWFFREWVYRPGYPYYSVNTVSTTPDQPFRVVIRQLQDTTAQTLFRMPIDLRVVTRAGDTLTTVLQNDAVYEQWFTPFPGIKEGEVGNMLFDPQNIILKRVTYRTLPANQAPAAPSHGAVLESAWPNPASGEPGGVAYIPFQLGRSEHVRIVVCDALGRSVVTAADASFDSGRHVVTFNTSVLPAGMYSIVLRGQGGQSARNFVVVR